MPIKLIQVQRKLNVGINTVVDFLQKKGFSVEDPNPNTRISDEQYALLVKEFGKDVPDLHVHKERKLTDRSAKHTTSEKKSEKSNEIKTEVPEEYKPKIVTKGRIDLDRPSKKTGESFEKKSAPAQPKEKEEVMQSVPQPEVVQPQPVTPEIGRAHV